MLAPEPEGWILQESQAFPFLEEASREFKEQWSLRTEQILDPKAGLIIDLVRDRLCYKLQLEMRAVADESMRLELSELNRALLLDHANDEIKFTLPTPQQFEGSFSHTTRIMHIVSVKTINFWIPQVKQPRTHQQKKKKTPRSRTFRRAPTSFSSTLRSGKSSGSLRSADWTTGRASRATRYAKIDTRWE